MATIDSLLSAIDEQTIAKQIGIPHDEARIHFSLESNTVGDFDEFTSLIGNYYNHHFSTCVSNGGSLSSADASGRAKEILERDYRRRNGDLVSAYNNAHDGTDGGVRAIVDILAEGLKAEAVERYIRDMFDKHIAPNSWEDKVEVIRQFIDRCGGQLSPAIQADQPERYAQNFNELIRSYVAGLQQTSSIFRRL